MRTRRRVDNLLDKVIFKVKRKMIYAHMKVAETYGVLSSATRLQVGCIIVKDDRIISIGYNGMPSGWSNVCEVDGRTKPEVLHSEANAITMLARSNESGLNAHLYTTHAPCMECAKLIHQTGIEAVIYKHKYREESGIEFLKKGEIVVLQIGDEI